MAGVIWWVRVGTGSGLLGLFRWEFGLWGLVLGVGCGGSKLSRGAADSLVAGVICRFVLALAVGCWACSVGGLGCGDWRWGLAAGGQS